MTQEIHDKNCLLLVSNPTDVGTLQDFLLVSFGCQVTWLKDALELEDSHHTQGFDLIIADQRFANSTPAAIQKFVIKHHPRTPLLYLVRESDPDFARWALRNDIHHLLPMPLDYNQARQVIAVTLAISQAAQDKHISEQEMAHIYSMLKNAFYQIEPIVAFIRQNRMSTAAIYQELELKRTNGACLFDELMPKDPYLAKYG